MHVKLLFHLCLVLLITLMSCKENPDVNLEQSNGLSLIENVSGQLEAFRNADIDLNSEKLVDLLWPEFTMLADGNYVVYQDVVHGSQTFMASLEIFNTEWKDLRVIPLGENYAISSFTFIDSLVAKDGTVAQSNGQNTFVWEKRDSLWKVLYADADHYPIE